MALGGLVDDRHDCLVLQVVAERHDLPLSSLVDAAQAGHRNVP